MSHLNAIIDIKSYKGLIVVITLLMLNGLQSLLSRSCLEVRLLVGIEIYFFQGLIGVVCLIVRKGGR